MDDKRVDTSRWTSSPRSSRGGPRGAPRGGAERPTNNRFKGLAESSVPPARSGGFGGGRNGAPRGRYGGGFGGFGGGSSGYGDHSRGGEVEEDGTWATRGRRRRCVEREEQVFSSTKEKTVGINFDSYDNIQVEISGTATDNIKPLNSFKDPGTPIQPELMANIERVQYDKPTPVQKYAIPILLNDRDLMACAQTGSGKTAAFLFPIIIKMMKSGPPAPNPAIYTLGAAEPVALVLSPTRELTCQIATESRKFAFCTGIRTVVVYGGAEVRTQLQELSRGCDICVATPGRLTDLMERGRVSLAYIKYLVLDEADRMLDMGFAPQINDIVCGSDMPQVRQTAMFSATFPREIQQLAATFMKNYVYLTVGRVGSTSEFITQTFEYAEESEKPHRLLNLLKDATGKVLVFVETKRKADLIEQFLNRNDLRAISIHGDRTQMERSHALQAFKTGTKSILVATDVAARGLDIHSITWVINLDLPHNIEDYVHRIGRTGRAGNNGLATSFVNESNKAILRDLHRLLEEAHQKVPSWLIDLMKTCSAVSSKGFGSSRYGNPRQQNRDYRRDFDGGRRTFNAARNAESFVRHSPVDEDCW